MIVTWNGAADIGRCLRSVFAHTRVDGLEVIVVDNGSVDGSADVARSFDGVLVIRNTENKGAGGARNQGIAAATGEFLLLLDCDTYVVDDVIGRSLTLLDGRPEVAMLACELRFPDGRRQHNAQRAMSIRLTLLRDLWLYKLLPRSRRSHVLLGGYYEGKAEVEADWLAAPFILLRRRVFVESGGFNEAIFPEDSEWGIRMSRAGHKIVYAPQLGFAYHTGGTGKNPGALRMHHIAGLKAYSLLNGRGLATCYWCAQLLGACVRWSVYTAANCLRANSFYASQADLYREILSIYATTPSRCVRGR